MFHIFQKIILFKAKFNKEEMGLKMISTTLTFNNINSIEKKIYGTYRIGTISTIISLYMYITEHKLYSCNIVAQTLSSITADKKILLSRGEPSWISLRMSSIFCLTSGHIDWGMYIREQAEHFCPPYSNADLTVPTATDFTSADLWTKWKFFPPHSKI